jgi:hypothetical protein
MNLKDETPIVMINVGELKEIIRKTAKNEDNKNKKAVNKQFVYGLEGIRKLFNVSHATAQRYKNTLLKEAISQQGRKIIVDVEKALDLFAKNNL